MDAWSTRILVPLVLFSSLAFSQREGGLLSQEDFYKNLNLENVSYSRALFRDLSDCQRSLEKHKSESSNKLINEFSYLVDREYFFEDGSSFVPIKLLGNLNPKNVPFNFSAYIVRDLERAHMKYSSVCRIYAPFLIGNDDFVDTKNAFTEKLSEPEFFYGLKAVLLASDYVSVSKVLKFVPNFIFEKYAFLSNSWFENFSDFLLKESKVKKSLKTLLGMSSKSLKKLSNKAFEIIAPYSYQNVFKSREDNYTFPFVEYHAQNYFNKKQIRHCIGELGKKIKSSFWELRNREEIYQNIKLKRKLCPGLSYLDFLSVWTIEDRTATLTLPFSLRKVLNEKAKYKSLPANLSVLNKKEKVLRDLYLEFAPLEKFTRLLQKNFYQTTLHHFIGPHFAKCALLNEVKGISSQEVDAMIYLYGAAYQVIDAETKLRVFGQEAEQVSKEAILDLNIWEDGLSEPCS